MESARKIIRIPFPSIRTQLIVVSLVVLILPWLGIQIIRDTESLLRQQQIHDLHQTGKIIIDNLGETLPALAKHHEHISQTPDNSEIYLSELPHPIRIDGYRDDWPEDRLPQHFTNVLSGNENTEFSFSLMAGTSQNAVLLLLHVNDDVLYLPTNPDQNPTDGDHLLLRLGKSRYVISSNTPGWLTAYDYDDTTNKDVQIKAELQPIENGYIVEIEIPLHRVAQTLTIAAVDRDNSTPDDFTMTGNTSLEKSGFILTQQHDFQSKLTAYTSSSRQLILTDARFNVLTHTNRINTQIQSQAHNYTAIIERIINLIVAAESATDDKWPLNYYFNDTTNPYGKFSLFNKQIQNDYYADGILTVHMPIEVDNRIIGFLVLRHSTHAITDIRHRALVDIFNKTALAIFVVLAVLLFYGRFLVKRIRKLNRQLQNAVNEDGRLEYALKQSRLKDEIGDLNQGMVDILERLNEYQRYMESMASKLSHELRTPMTIVQSSLENLQQEQNVGNHSQFIQRAEEGLSRLRLILSNLTEASRLESSLKNTEAHSFDLVAVISGCVQGYQQAYSGYNIRFDTVLPECELTGSPELIAQLLDKLVSNAIDFHTPDTPILIQLLKHKKHIQLSVENQGEMIPEDIQKTMFDSMVSQRQHKDEQPHLGLGLYIVKLIASFHGAEISVENTQSGVRFLLSFK